MGAILCFLSFPTVVAAAAVVVVVAARLPCQTKHATVMCIPLLAHFSFEFQIQPG